MNKQKKQNLLTTIIVILVTVVIMLIGSIAYEELINRNKQPIQNTNAPVINKEESNIAEKDEDKNENQGENEKKPSKVEEDVEKDNVEKDNDEKGEVEEGYIGEEENNKEQPQKTTDEKVVDLVKKEWGQDDSVTFSIEKKNGAKYRVAVRDDSTTVLQWYEVNIETWEVSEY